MVMFEKLRSMVRVKVRKSLVMVLLLVISTQVWGAVGWWNKDYKYRRELTITTGTSAVSTGYAVKITAIDTSSLETSGKIQPVSGSDRKDFRIVYWNGSSYVELERYYAGVKEIWFKLQSAISSNSKDSNYYIYYGNSKETTTPLNNPYNLFELRTQSSYSRFDDAFGIATYIDSSTGKITPVNQSVARFQAGRFGSKAYLAEGTLSHAHQNFLIQSSFESDSAGSAPTGWTVGAGSPTVQTTYAKHGDKSVRISASSGRSYVTQNNASLGLYKYTASAWVYIESYTGGSIELALQDVTNTATFYAIADTSKVGQWQRILVMNTTASTSITVWLDVGRTAATATVYFDAIQLEQTRSTIMATSYIPTTATVSVQRGTDDLRYSTSGTPIIKRDKGTFVCWLAPHWGTAGAEDWSSIIVLFATGGGNGRGAAPGNATRRIYAESGGTLNIADADINFSSGQFTHFALTWNESTNTFKIYGDGVEIPSTKYGSGWSDIVTAIQIGYGVNAGVGLLNGLISDIGIYDNVLTAAEISALYTAQNSGTRKLTLPIETLSSGANLIFALTLDGDFNARTRTIVFPEPSITAKSEQYVATEIQGEGTIIAEDGGEISAYGDSLTKISLPAKATEKNIKIIIKKNQNIIIQKVKEVLPVTGYDFEATESDTGSSVKRFDKLITIAIHYPDSISGDDILDESGNSLIKVNEASKRLSLGFWNGIDWQLIGGSVTTSSNNRGVIVTGRVNHLSTYAIVVKPANLTDIEARVAPNPFTPKASQFNTVIFSFNNENNEQVEIMIWDLTAGLVRRLESSGGTSISWDGKNEYGEYVEGGVYIYQLKVGNNRVKRGTIVVAY